MELISITWLFDHRSSNFRALKLSMLFKYKSCVVFLLLRVVIRNDFRKLAFYALYFVVQLKCAVKVYKYEQTHTNKIKQLIPNILVLQDF